MPLRAVWLLLLTTTIAQSLEQNKTQGERKNNVENDIIPGEFIIAVDESVSKTSGVTNLKEVAEQVYSLQVKKEVRLGSSVYLIVSGNASDVARIATRHDVRFTEPNKVVRATVSKKIDTQSFGRNETPGKKTDNPENDIIPGEFIIAVDESLSKASGVTSLKEVAEQIYSLQVKKEVRLGTSVFLIVSGKASDVARIATRHDVRFTEPNKLVRANYMQAVCSSTNVGNDLWGLARIDQRASLSWTYEYRTGDLDDGSGVTAYVVDSGIEISHFDFTGRVRHGFTASEFTSDTDYNGHGTHVAGTIGGTLTGVAKQVSLVAVKVLGADGSGTLGGILEGFQWLIQDFLSNGRPKSVVNLSLGLSGISETLDDAVDNVIDNGIPVVAAAGNDYRYDACNLSPGRVPRAVTVGATTINDNIADFSNIGSCVDLFAPGEDIYSTMTGGTYATYSGTSMATPHVTGVIARYLSTLSSRPSTYIISDWLERASTKGAIVCSTCTNRLVYAHCYTGDGWDYEDDSPDEPSVCYSAAVGGILWGLARIDQRASLSGTYEYSIGTLDDGDGVTAYVVDSGIETSHFDFTGRVRHGFTASEFYSDTDQNGHGTHVAGIIGGTTTGVAKQVSLVAVKVLGADGSGTLGGILEGFQWLIQDFLSNGRPKSVVNLSLGLSGISETMDDAVDNVIDNGIPVVAAAGNDYRYDACNLSPGRVPRAVTVGATTINDYIADFSNIGLCVDLFAPGEDILSTMIGGSFATGSGTSQAAPHVAGAIARYLSTHSSRPSPSDVSDWLEDTSTKGAIAYGSCPNRLLYAYCYSGEGWEYDYGNDLCEGKSLGSRMKVALVTVSLMGTIAYFVISA